MDKIFQQPANIAQGPENPGLGAGGVLTIDLGALQHNYRLLCQKAAPAEVSAVVKADAYGTGAAYTVPALYQAGCRTFFVAQLIEAFRLRSLLPQDVTIAVLNDIQPGTEAIAADAGILPVLNSLASVHQWAALCRARTMRLPAVLQLDTGMARLGLDAADFEALCQNPEIFQIADIRLIISHLACGDEQDNPANTKQLQKLQKLTSALPQTRIGFANSGGVFLGNDFHFDLVRPGIALYGVDPLGDKSSKIRPVISLEARVIQTRHVEAGQKVGYGGAFETTRPTRIATIAVGYADGWHRCLGNQGAAFFKGVRLPIIGRVSMDSITLDATALAEDALKRGDLVELIGKNQTLEDVARDAQTIPYEILTSLGHRYDRRYKTAS